MSLKKDTYDYYTKNYGRPDIQDPYFKKDCIFIVHECGFSNFYVTETGKIIQPVENDNEEFCFVESFDEDLDQITLVEGLVKAADLQIDDS